MGIGDGGDIVARAIALIDRGVGAGAAVEEVVPAIAGEDVVSGKAAEAVVAERAGEIVGELAAVLVETLGGLERIDDRFLGREIDAENLDAGEGVAAMMSGSVSSPTVSPRNE
jgi:hypothetical protein